jgi:hypothetical protein
VLMETTLTLSNSWWMLLGLRALRHCLLSADHQLKLEEQLLTASGAKFGGWVWLQLYNSEVSFQACAQHICAVDQRQECRVHLQNCQTINLLMAF